MIQLIQENLCQEVFNGASCDAYTRTLCPIDQVGNLKTYTREDGTVIEYFYDDVNRLWKVDYPALPGVAADAVIYTYDELYRIRSQSDNDSSVLYDFDPISRLISTTQTWNGQQDTITFDDYSLIDLYENMTDATGKTIYKYDDLNRLKTLTDSANRAFVFDYDELNRLDLMTNANGTSTKFNFDDADQLEDIITKKMSTSEIIESIVYTYKTTGTRETETRLDGNVRTFFYDANDRVEQVETKNGSCRKY